MVKQMKVLAVDDNRTNLHILQVFLKKLGHLVVVAENGQEAVKCFQEESPDLVLLDIMMPVMDGFEAARQIKATNRDRWTPIIFLSALNRDENLVAGLDAGADDYLTKPINFVVLEAKLRSMQRSLALQQESIDALRRIQAISDNVSDAIVTMTADGLIATVNQSTERIFGWDANEIIGRPLQSLLDDNAITVSAALESTRGTLAASAATNHEQEVVGKHRNGKSFPATITLSHIELDSQTLMIAVIRDVSERKAAEHQLQENALQLQRYYDHTQTEQQLALRLMEKQLHRQGLTDPSLKYAVVPAEHFSGDFVAAARSSEGRRYALLADATGHGLTAAISVLPVLALFYRMSKLNRSIQEMVLELNQQLKESMPVGRFVAATLLCLDGESRQGEIWVGGTPQALFIDRWGRVVRTFESKNLALGVVGNEDLGGLPEQFTWEQESQLILCSDGLIEAENPSGQQFGAAGVIAATANTSPGDRFQKIQSSLHAHQNSISANDDISLMVIDCP